MKQMSLFAIHKPFIRFIQLNPLLPDFDAKIQAAILRQMQAAENNSDGAI